MAMAMIAGGAITGITLLTKEIADKLLPSNDGSNFGEETLNNSTIGHEEKITDQQYSCLTLKMEVLH